MATNEKKMTKVQAFSLILNAVDGMEFEGKEEAMEKLSAEIDRLIDKANKPSKATAGNVGLGELLLDFMAKNAERKFTVSELVKSVPGFPEEISAPKVTALLRLETVKPYIGNAKEKGKSLYWYIPAEDEFED